MKSSRVQAWVWWLLPILVARSLLPVGFMPQAQDGRLQIVLCQSGIAQLHALDAKSGSYEVAATAAQHAAQTAHWQHDVSCPFGHAVAAPIPFIGGTDAIELLPSAENPARVAPSYEPAGPPRFIATRGPPALI